MVRVVRWFRWFRWFGWFDDLYGPLLLPAQLVIQKKPIDRSARLGATGFLYTKQTF
ncbi:hypothetical protein [Paenibacillus chitinolyticus]|uniref:hypothetical protein n=1 Tax=Paenibacillus chitinolyticus TaxID=79263 RepID=UPI00366DF65D